MIQNTRLADRQGIQTQGDLIVGQPVGGVEDHPGAHHLEIRQRISCRPVFQFMTFMTAENNFEWAVSWHGGIHTKNPIMRKIIRYRI